MSTLEKKRRTLADFFNPTARSRLFPSVDNVVPQKRASPTPPTNDIPQKRPSLSPDTSSPPRKRSSASPLSEREKSPIASSIDELPKATPSKQRALKHARTPIAPSFSPISLPRSGSLPIRSPHPKSVAKPASVYKNARLFETSPASSSGSTTRYKTPTSEKRPDASTSISISQAPASTQSVVREGKLVAVRDSDEDDSDSLASLDELFGTRRDDDATSTSSPPEPDDAKLEFERRRVLSAFTHGRSEPLVGKDKLRALYAKEKAQQSDISRLINDHFDEVEEDQRILKSREQYEQSVKSLQSGHGELDTNLLASLIQDTGGDDDDLSRLMNAVSRTEALSGTKSFSFFGPSGMTDLEAEALAEYDFPDVPFLSSLFRSYDDTGRTRAYLSGYMSELAASAQLPDEVLNWTFRSVLVERNEYIRQSYIDCLRQGSSSWARTNVEARDVEEMFEMLGADSSSLKDSIVPAYQPVQKQAAVSPKYLLTLLDLFQAICQHMDFLALASLSSIICRLTLDEELMSNGAVASKAEQVLQTLLDLPDQETRQHITECIVNDMAQHLSAPNLQAQLLSHLMPTSTAACHLRVQLAHVSLMGLESHALTRESSAITFVDLLTNLVKTSPDFDNSARNARKLNYGHLRAHAMILDTAISDGNRRAAFAGRSDEAAFNTSVDALADAIKARYSSISDSGASHISRTEAKDALTAVYWRVLMAVRTKPRPKKHIFDSNGQLRDAKELESEDKGREVMKGFLNKMKAKKKKEDEAPALGVVSQDEPMSSCASAKEELERPYQ